MGTIIGGATMASSLGMAAGGPIFDDWGSYGWRYLGSFGTGLGAAAIMLVFTPAGCDQTTKLAGVG